jgi:hypothetical protein
MIEKGPLLLPVMVIGPVCKTVSWTWSPPHTWLSRDSILTTCPTLPLLGHQSHIKMNRWQSMPYVKLSLRQRSNFVYWPLQTVCTMSTCFVSMIWVCFALKFEYCFQWIEITHRLKSHFTVSLIGDGFPGDVPDRALLMVSLIQGSCSRMLVYTPGLGHSVSLYYSLPWAWTNQICSPKQTPED